MPATAQLQPPTAARIVARARAYLAIGAVVGAEGPLLRAIAADLSAEGCPARLGDGVLEIGDPSAPVAVTAHVDRHGLAALGAGRFGYAAHAVVEREGGSTHPSRAFSARVCGRVAGERVFAYDPATGVVLGQAEVPHACDLTAGTVVDIPALGDVPEGTPVAFALGCAEDGERIRGQLDNALGVALAVELVLAGAASRVILTAREEVGGSADLLVAHLAGARPRLVVLDTSPFPDPAHAERGEVVLRRRDAGAAFDAALTAWIAATADDHGVPVTFKDAWIEAANAALGPGGHPAGLGRTELGRVIALTEGAVTGTTVQVPTYDYHTNHEATTAQAVDAAARVLAAALPGAAHHALG